LHYKNHKFYNCEIELSDGNRYRVSAVWLHNSQLDFWKGWECSAGFKRLDVDMDFNVFSARCKNESLGNLFGGWKIHDKPSICRKDRCSGCTDDLLVEKNIANTQEKTTN
jgi:hypothetical protein